MNILRKGFIYGGDYNPEQWLDRPDILEKDIVLMKKARINTVTLGVFSWSVLEPEEDHYHFQWLIDTINRLYENGIQVILATPSGARPRWLAEKYPEVLRVREDRVRYHYGERHNHCYTSLFTEKRYGKSTGNSRKRFGITLPLSCGTFPMNTATSVTVHCVRRHFVSG